MATSKWEEVKEKLTLIKGWARDGLTNEQIANNLGINVSTIYDYQNKYPEFAEALKKGKEIIDYEVENALLKRALGYNYEEKTYEKTYNKELDKYTETLIKRVTKQVAPDTTALIFWLKNRKPQQWRDKIDVEKENKVQRIEIINDLPSEEDNATD